MEEKINNFKNFDPLTQLTLYGYSKYFNFFSNLFLKGELPQVNLISGKKGLGKSTFAFHLINYFLSINEDNAYSLSNFTINPKNKNYNLLFNNVHPNYFLVEKSENSKFIDVDQIRLLIKNLNLSNYNKSYRFILINDIENLNKNSANALLKILEEPPKNTFFFLIYDTAFSILDTIKSRTLEFKINFTHQELEKIFNILSRQFFNATLKDDFPFNELLDTPGSSLNYMNFYLRSNIKQNSSKREIIENFISYYLKSRNKGCLSLIFNLIEIYFIKLISMYPQNINFYNKRDKILNLISCMKIYNLDEKNIFFEVIENLPYEQT